MTTGTDQEVLWMYSYSFLTVCCCLVSISSRVSGPQALADVLVGICKLWIIKEKESIIQSWKRAEPLWP